MMPGFFCRNEMFRELGFYMMPGFFCRNEMFRELGFYMMPGFFCRNEMFRELGLPIDLNSHRSGLLLSHRQKERRLLK